MQLKHISIDTAIGAILVHNIAGADGRKALAKGHIITANDVPILRTLDKDSVYVAVLDPGDVREDDAATQLARTVAGSGVELSKPSGGRVNLYSTQNGFLKINRDALKRINELDRVTLATIPRYSSVIPRKMIATLKTVGLALPESILREAEKIIGARGKALDVAPRQIENVAVILTGSESGKARTQETFASPIRARVEALGAHVSAEAFVIEDADAIAATLVAVLGAGAQLVIIAGETLIMDADDIVPHSIRQAGGTIELYGAPVEPGNLLLLAYIGSAPIVGAPGCIKSRETNVVDLILPPLFAGERVTRQDVIALAEGGLLIG